MIGLLQAADKKIVLNALTEVMEMTQYEPSLLSAVSTLLRHEQKEARFAAADAIYTLAKLDGCFADDTYAECKVILEVYDKLPVATKTVHPKYPQEAVERRLDADVRLKILVDSRGHVVDASVLGPASVFAVEAVRAAKRWRFEPAESNGAKVPIVGIITTSPLTRENLTN